VGVSPGDHTTGAFYNLLERFLHVFGLLYFVVAPLVVEPQHRDAILVDRIGIDLTIVVFACNCLATARHAKRRAIEIAVVVFQGRAITSRRFHLAIATWIFSIGILNA